MYLAELKRTALKLQFKEWEKLNTLKLRAGGYNPRTLYSQAWAELKAKKPAIKPKSTPKKRTVKKKK